MKKFLDSFRSEPANLLLLALATLKLLIHLFTSGQYGYFRDEFYYIAASKHLALGYVDFPPFIAGLTAFVRATLGESLLALRFFPALSGAILVFLTGLMARQLGAGRFGQALAALATLIAPQFLGVNSILTMDSFDTLFWGLALYILILILKQDQPRLWLWFGLVAGISLTAKISMLYFGLAMVVGMVLTPARKHFRSPWLYAGGAIALLFLLPYIIWNATQGWPTVEFWGAYAEKVYQAPPLEFILQQILIMHPFSLPLWGLGLGYVFSKKGAAYRLFGWAYIVLLLVFMLQHAKNYFLAPFYPVLFAAGAVFFEQWAVERWGWVRQAYVITLVITGLLVAPGAIPILPLPAHLAYMRAIGGASAQSEVFESGVFPQHFADRFGWEELAAQVQKVYQSLPPEDQGRVCIFTGNYGEAGALEFYRARYGLPPVTSGHNNYYLWGPGSCSGEILIVLGAASREGLQQVFTEVRPAGQTSCEYCMPYENHLPIYVARGLNAPLEQLWPGVKEYQ